MELNLNTQRIWAINSFIQLRGEVHLKELMELYPNVSAMTIRRDVDYLEKQGHIVRTRGGAKSIRRLTQVKEDAYSKRSAENTDKKSAVAQKALQFFGKAGSYYIDAGTTMMHLALIIPENHYFFITNAPNIGMELTRNANANVVQLGGRLNPEYYSISGASAVEQIKKINIDVAFIATSGFSLVNGFTNGSFDECELKRAVIAKAQKTVVLMDSSKYDRTLPYTFANLDEIDVLITDAPLPDEVYEQAASKNTQIL